MNTTLVNELPPQRQTSNAPLRKLLAVFSTRTALMAFLIGFSACFGCLSAQVISHQLVAPGNGNLQAPIDLYDAFGMALAPLGDFDGDGVPDLVAGALGDDDGGGDRGAVHLLFMNPNGTVRAEQKISQTQGGFTGSISNTDLFGHSVSLLGDVDGDGIPDLAVGAPQDDDGAFNSGAAWVLFLKPDGTVKGQQKISPTTGGFGGVLSTGDKFGFSLAGVGDVDGDGIPDLAVGAPYDDAPGQNAGAIYLLLLKSDGSVRSWQKISYQTGGFPFLLDPFDLFGLSLANVGDIDGDGKDELAVGTPGDDDGALRTEAAGAIYLLRLRPTGEVNSASKVSNTAGNFRGELRVGGKFGSAIAGIGDENKDGIPDLVVGTPSYSGLEVKQGAVWLLNMKADGSVKEGRRITEIEGNFFGGLGENHRFGSALAGLGDLNGDGAPDWAGGLIPDPSNWKGGFFTVFGEPDTLDCGGQPCGLLKGKAFMDRNFDCMRGGPGDDPVEGALVMVEGNGLRRWARTDTAGEYRFSLPAGNYRVELQFRYGVFSICARDYQASLTPGGTREGRDFNLLSGCSGFLGNLHGRPIAGDSCPGGAERTSPCPGDQWEYCFTMGNLGPETWFGPTRFTLEVDSGMTIPFQNPFPTCNFFNGNPTLAYTYTFFPASGNPHLMWVEIGGLSPGTCDFCFETVVDTLGTGNQGCNGWFTQVSGYATCLPSQAQLVNMKDSLCEPDVCACDPNEIQVFPSGCGPQGLLAPQILSYKVRFQNEGLGPATDAIILDSLPAALDPASLQITGSSHPITNSQILAGNVLQITWSGINLPSAITHPGQGNGYIEFSLTPFPGLQEGTVVQNRARIFFDQNDAVTTNTVLNTFFTDPEPVVNLGPDLQVDPNIPAAACADLIPTVFGGLPPYTYLWNTGANTASITVCPNSNQIYSLTVTDAQGACTGFDQIKVGITDLSCEGSGSKKGITLCHKGGSPQAHTHCIAEGKVDQKLRQSAWSLGPCPENVDCPPGRTQMCFDSGQGNSRTHCVKDEKVKQRLGTQGWSLGSCGGGAKRPASMESENGKPIVEAFPNPFNQSTTFHIIMPDTEWAQLEILDLQGRSLFTLWEGEIPGGREFEIPWEADKLAQGLYFYRFSTENHKILTGKLVLKR